MKFKAIFTDLDDTLLTSKGIISKEDKEMIIEAQKKGVKFILASGRPTFAMLNLSKELELDKYKSYILSFNGGVVMECSNNKILFEEALSKDDIHKLYDFSKENKLHIITYFDKDIISETTSEYIDVEVNLTGMNHRLVKDFKMEVNRSAIKCIILGEPSYLKKMEKELKEKYGSEYSIAISKPFFLEVTKRGIDKGNTLKRLIDKLNIKQEETIAVGDSYNDLSMLNAAGLAIAVDNAKPEIKEVADYITTSNDENGMANLIKKYILNI
ncbi:Cof-type HAD-IIB family hydrolase [Cetobacterium sp. SF1]|uniref:Cof-type HAD-IIB family hydrolase n=1 Tax=Cetobacterium sp. SF1 TaxID=3417654 RepID=UPI003CE6BD9D